MNLYLDSADLNEIARWRSVISGVTTNPTFLSEAEWIARITEICKIVEPEHVSVELLSRNASDMQNEARNLRALFPGLVIKVPVLNPDGSHNLDVIRAMPADIKVNATICMSFNQLMFATLAGASYVSLFWGRVADEGGDPAQIVRDYSSWLYHDANRNFITNTTPEAELIVGSIRSPADMQAAAIAGADIVTVPPDVLAKAIQHRYSQETSRQLSQGVRA